MNSGLVVVAYFLGFREEGKVKPDFDTATLLDFVIFGGVEMESFGLITVAAFLVFREGGKVKPDFDLVTGYAMAAIRCSNI